MLLDQASTLSLDPILSHFQAHGYARLGRVMDPDAAVELGLRADSLMMASEPFEGMFFQHDAPTGEYEDLNFGAGWIGPSPRYRKIERLELDPRFLEWIANPLFERIAKSMLGDGVKLYRSVLWNKAPRVGMAVPWHQDDGRFWGLNQAPFLQVWTALDDAPAEAGCLEVVPGSHLGGLATPEGGTVPTACFDGSTPVVSLPAKRGECLLVHNHTWHRTGRNQSDAPRRAISVSFLGSDVTCARRKRAPRQFKTLF